MRRTTGRGTAGRRRTIALSRIATGAAILAPSVVQDSGLGLRGHGSYDRVVEPQPLELPEGRLSDGVVAVRSYRVEDAPLLAVDVKDEEVERFAFVRWSRDTSDELARRIAEEWPQRAREGRNLSVSIRDAESDELLGHFVV